MLVALDEAHGLHLSFDRAGLNDYMAGNPDPLQLRSRGTPCTTCGDPEGCNPFDGSCVNHDTWVECPDCQASYPLLAGATFNADFDGLPEYDCPACNGESA